MSLERKLQRSRARGPQAKRGPIRVPGLGSISKPIPLEGCEPIEIQVEYKGTCYLAEVQAGYSLLNLEEEKRKAALAVQYPGLKISSTPEFISEHLEHIRQVVSEIVARVHGIERLTDGKIVSSTDETDRVKIAEWLESVGIQTILTAYKTAIAVQEPKESQVFC